MALHAALVATLDDILQGIKAGVSTTCTGEVAGPRLDAGLIHRVTHRAHLEVDRIEAVDLQGIKQTVHLGFLLSCSSALRGPVKAPDGGYPCRAKFTFGLTIGPGTRHHARQQKSREHRCHKAFHNTLLNLGLQFVEGDAGKELAKSVGALLQLAFNHLAEEEGEL